MAKEGQLWIETARAKAGCARIMAALQVSSSAPNDDFTFYTGEQKWQHHPKLENRPQSASSAR